MNAKTYTGSELRMALQNQFAGAFLGPVVLMNDRYCAVPRAWVERQFSKYIWAFEQSRGQLVYRKRGNQCEHYALRAALEVVDLFRLMPDDQVPADAESIAVAAIKYLKGAGTPAATWHEINLWFHEGRWFPWEPQQRLYLTFTDAELVTVQQPIIP
jgi:hypothetical protein